MFSRLRQLSTAVFAHSFLHLPWLIDDAKLWLF